MSLCLLPVLHLLLLHHTLTLDMDVHLLHAAHMLWHYLSRAGCPLLTSSEAFTHESFLASLRSQQIGIRKSYSPAWSWSRGGVCCHSTPSLSSRSAVARPGPSRDLLFSLAKLLVALFQLLLLPMLLMLRHRLSHCVDVRWMFQKSTRCITRHLRISPRCTEAATQEMDSL